MYIRVVLLDQQIPSRKEGGSQEVNCRSFRVLPLHSRASYFPFPTLRSLIRVYLLIRSEPTGGGDLFPNHSDNVENFNNL